TMEVVISKVYRGTPAEEAGLMNGDQVLKVNDIDATSMELSDLVQNIRGDEGTTVYMMIYRESTQETLEFNVERRYVELPSIEGEMLANGIGYIQITEFQSKTAEQFDAMVAELKEQGMKGLILDVRANPGGYLSAVVDILDSILPEGLLVYTEDKYGVRKEYNSDSACMEMPLVVMIDESSASASEILAGAIKDYEYGTLIGKTTFGKGIVQNILQLSDGDAVKLTTSKYFTPKGNYIHEVGIAPDIEVEYEYSGSKEESYQKEYDSQFIKALEIMEGMLAQ
ncbi:MAG: S41 family peptidase, partial [Lachnospiraceae bacterium]|nr:S41 family peptidase [Lachnospiraceae bacterium]